MTRIPVRPTVSDMEPMIPTAEESPTVDVRLAGKAFGLGATTSYTRAASGQLVDGVPVIKVGSKYRVPTVALRRALGLDHEATTSK